MTKSTAPGKATRVSSSHSMAPTSRWLVGSSRSSRSGSSTSARASATRFLIPPERSATCASSGRARRVSMASMRCWIVQPPAAFEGFLEVVQPRHERRLRLPAGMRGQRVRHLVVLHQQPRALAQPLGHRLEDREPRGKRGLLGDEGEPRARREADQAVVGARRALDDLQQARLAGAVAADEADALARLDHQVGVVEQRHVPVGERDGGELEEGQFSRRGGRGTAQGYRIPWRAVCALRNPSRDRRRRSRPPPRRRRCSRRPGPGA